jgi:hypothetical protein
MSHRGAPDHGNVTSLWLQRSAQRLTGAMRPAGWRLTGAMRPAGWRLTGAMRLARLGANGGYAIGALAEMTCVLLRPVSLA